MFRLDLAKERITDVGSPCFGWDMGEVWATIKDDTSHPAWDMVSWDACRYLSLVSGMKEVFGPQMSVEEYQALSEDEQIRIDEREETLYRSAYDISAEVIHDLDIYLHFDIDTANSVEEATKAGLHAAYVLAKQYMPGSLEA